MKDGFHTALPGQVDEVFALYEKRVQWMNENGIRQWNENAYLQVFPRAYYASQQEAGRLYVWTEGDCVLGAAVLLEADEGWIGQADHPALYVHNLVTDSSARGIGVKLLSAAEVLARQRGVERMRLDCAVDNAFLNRYYEGMGYLPAGQCADGPYVGVLREKRIGAF